MRSLLARASAALAASASAVFCAVVSNRLRQFERQPASDAGLHEQDDGVKNDAAEIGAAGIDGRRKQEVQHQMMQRDRDRAGEDRRDSRNRRPGTPARRRSTYAYRSARDVRPADRRTPTRRPSARRRRSGGSRGRCRNWPMKRSRQSPSPPYSAVGPSQPLSRIMPMASAIGNMKPKQSEQSLAGGFAQRREIIAFNGHFRILNIT